jgi:hypothetical protein
VEPLLNEGMAKVVLATIGQNVIAIAAPVRDHVIMVVVRMGDTVGLGAITEEGYAAVIRPADGAMLEANEQPDKWQLRHSNASKHLETPPPRYVQIALVLRPSGFFISVLLTPLKLRLTTERGPPIRSIHAATSS